MRTQIEAESTTGTTITTIVTRGIEADRLSESTAGISRIGITRGAGIMTGILIGAQVEAEEKEMSENRGEACQRKENREEITQKRESREEVAPGRGRKAEGAAQRKGRDPKRFDKPLIETLCVPL